MTLMFRLTVAAAATAAAHAAAATPAATRTVVEPRNMPSLQARQTEMAPVANPTSSLPSWRGGGAAPSKVRGVVSMGGGVLAHLVLGTMYCWANFISYAPESIMYFNGLSAEANGFASPDALQMMPVTLAFLCMGLKVGGMIMKQYGPRFTSVLGSILFAGGVFSASFQTRLIPFMICYACVVGLGIGIGYNPPMIAGWSWFPEKKGIVNGVILTGFGAGGFIFNKIGTSIMNPDGLSTLPPNVSEMFPTMLRKLASIYAVMSIAGSLLIKKNESLSAAKGEKTVSPAAKEAGMEFVEALYSRKFVVLWCMILATAGPVLNMGNMYKKFAAASGSAAISSDVFQSTMGGLGAIFNGIGRLFWGAVVDMYGFEKPYSVLALLEVALLLLMPRVTDSKALFGAALCGIFFCLGGNFVMFPTVNAKTFGVKNAAEIYSVLFSGFAVAAIGGAKLSQKFLGALGWGGLINAMTVVALMGLLLLNLL